MGGKILATTKNSTSESLKCEGDVDSFFFYWKGIVHHEFVPRGETVNKEFYLNVMKLWDTAGLWNDSRSKAHMLLFILVCHTVVTRGCVMRCASNCLAWLEVCT